MRFLTCLLSVGLSTSAFAVESAYTKTNFDKDCKVIEEGEAGGVTAICPGLLGYQIHFTEGDLRQSAFYGYVGQWHAAGAFESFGPFNYAAPTVEWRIENGRPFATIRRWFVSMGEDANGKPLPVVQVLVVSRVAQKDDGEGCIVAYVEATANKNANDLARKAADEEARDFACRYAEPTRHGAGNSDVSKPVSHFEQRAPE